MRNTWIAVLLAALALVPFACKQNREKKLGEQYGKYTLLDTYYDNADPVKAKENVADVLTRLKDQPNVCLIGLWAYNPPAILSAVKEAQATGKVKIVGFDEDEDTLQGIKDGHIFATVVQNPYEFGFQSVERLAGMGKKKIGFVTNNPAEFWTIVEAGTARAAAKHGVEVLFRRPKNKSTADQKEIIDDLLTKQVDAIAISVIDPVNQKDYLNEIAAKVTLITQDNDAPQTNRKFYLGTDNYTAGRAVGELVKEAMPEGGTIAIFVGQPDPLNARQRREGVLDALAGKETSDIADRKDPAIIHVPHRIIRKNNPDKDNDVEVFHQRLRELMGK